MTEFEMAYLLTDMQSAIANQSTVFFTGVSGFLIGGYVAAHRLNRVMLTVVVIVYTFWFVPTTFLLSRMGIALGSLVRQIHDFADAGKGLQWHPAAHTSLPDWMFELGPYPTYVFNFIVYAGTIYFFLHCRRVNRKTDMVVETPKV